MLCVTKDRLLMNAPKPQSFVLSRMRAGPICQDSLSKELLGHIAVIYRQIGRHLGMNLEQFEIGFMREESPEVRLDERKG